MKFLSKKMKGKVQNTLLYVLCLLAVAVGFAYAEKPATTSVTIPCPPNCVSAAQQKANNDEDLTSTNGGNGAAVADSESLGAEAAAVAQTQNLQSHEDQIAYTDLAVANIHSIPPGAASAMAALIRSNQANMKVYAAADTLANALAYRIIEHYFNSGKTREQIIAEIIEEGISHGYIKNVQSRVAGIDSNTGLATKAYAALSAGGPGVAGPVGPGQRDASRGQPADISKLTDGQFGPQIPGSGGSPAEELGRSSIYTAKVAFLTADSRSGAKSATPGNESCGQGNASVNCDSQIFDQLAYVVHNAGALDKSMHELTSNAVASGSGATGDNSDHSSFFISSAHAIGTGGAISGLVRQLAQAEQQAKQAAAKIPEGEQSDVLSPRQLSLMNATADGTSGNTGAAKMGARSFQDTMKAEEEGAHKASLQFFSM